MSATAAILCSLVISQAWTRDQGSAYFNLSLTTFGGDRAYSAEFQAIDIVPYRQTSLGFYGEVGLIDRWLTASLSSEVLRHNRLQNRGSTFGLGDTRLGFWTGVVTEPVRISLGFVTGLPTGDPRPDAGAGADRDALLIAASLPTGDGEWDFSPRVALGWSFSGGNYLLAETGYALRTQNFADAIDYRLEVGVRFFERFLLIGKFYGTESFASTATVQDGFSGLGNGVTHTSFGAAIHARLINRFGVSIGADTAVRARGIVAATPLRFGVSWEI
jgi:hypothetical protein